MVLYPPKSTLLDLVTVLSEAMDLVSPLLVDHHSRTAWFAVHLARQMGFTRDEVATVHIASLLHDVGAFSLKERLDTLQFEFDNPHHHACLGYKLLHDFGPLREEAVIIFGHHGWWKPEVDDEPGGESVSPLSHVLHLADRAAILMENGVESESQLGKIVHGITSREGTVFMPEAVRAFKEISPDDELWQGAISPNARKELRSKVDDKALHLVEGDLENLARLFAKIIDYRSHFTATHSAGVAAVAETLAGMLGFSPENCETIKVAGYLHDLGKLTIPTELIEKPGRLDDSEYVHVQDHARQTRRFLERIPELGHGIEWAAQHHERLNGSGYPEHCSEKDIAFGSRVVAVADILTAVTEDRPYRDGMGRDGALDVLTRLTEEGYLDPEVFGTAAANFEELNAVRLDAQAEAEEDYRCRIGEFVMQEPGASSQ